jgi:hypothetical protein
MLSEIEEMVKGQEGKRKKKVILESWGQDKG